MKKIILCFTLILLLTGCGKNNVEDVKKRFSDDVNNSKSYNLIGKMSIIGDEEEFNYSIDVKYLEDNYYKVELYNTSNDHEQIILRNDDGVYVITPALNKSFKFQNSWPDNSSQAYLLKPLLKDINNDDETKLTEKDKMYILKSKVNYPNNDELVYQEIYFDSKMVINKVVVYDSNSKERIVVEFTKVDLKSNFDKSDFDINQYISNETENEDNQQSCTGDECDKTTSGLLEDIIYPLYLPNNTYLTSSEKISDEDSHRVILTFNGEKDFTIVEETEVASEKFEITPVFGEPIFLNDTLGVIEDNSISWTKNNVNYYLTSNTLSPNEMRTIAVSMNLTKSVMESK